MKISTNKILPEYPSTLHLPYKPNTKGDKVASEFDVAPIFIGPITCIQEKIDGANCGMAYIDGHPVLRSRTKILRKGQELKNPSKAQFGAAWNWMHQREKAFKNLNDCGPYSIYGEWMVQQHGMAYDDLPDWFIGYDIYDWEKSQFVDPHKAQQCARNCGFEFVRNSFYADPTLNKPLTYEFIEECANYDSWYTAQKREGVIVKVSDGEFITHRFKMVREGFDQGCLLGDEIKKNKLGV